MLNGYNAQCCVCFSMPFYTHKLIYIFVYIISYYFRYMNILLRFCHILHCLVFKLTNSSFKILKYKNALFRFSITISRQFNNLQLNTYITFFFCFYYFSSVLIYNIIFFIPFFSFYI